MPAQKIENIDLVHFCHTDYGFTDHPAICRELQRRYIDIAIDTVLATSNGPAEKKFYWTVEMTVAVKDWWEQASEVRRQEFLQAVETGQLDVTALPLNQIPTLSRREWEKMVHWLPEDLWQKVRPQSAVQNDVNGMPRAGAVTLLDRGIRYLFLGINADSGGPPFPQPSAFWWKMPDGRRMFVWQGIQYCMGLSFFEPVSWRRGPVVEFQDTRFRPPRRGEILPTDEPSMRKAHAYLLERIGQLEAAGYSYKNLLLSMTNEWRMDGDPPFPPLADFVAEWNRLGLMPTLRLTTVSTAMKRMEEEVGGQIAEHAGEWTDWWANGIASNPREIAASRMAKRIAAAAESPVWGPLDERGAKYLDEIYEQLCLFDEHTWGHCLSVAKPDALEVIAQYNEKSRLVYRPWAQAQFLLAQRIRHRLADAEEGFYVINTAKQPWSGWVTMWTSCLRADYRSVEDTTTGVKTPLEFRPGIRPFERPQSPQEFTVEDSSETFADNYPDKIARFWVEGLKAGETRRLQLSLDAVEYDPSVKTAAPIAEVDAQDWPTSMTWPSMQRPLFLPGIGEFLSVGIRGFAPRWIAKEVFDIPDPAERERRRCEVLEEIPAIPAGRTTVERNATTTVYTQALQHPRLKWASRQLEVFHREPHARLTLRLYRNSSEDPELFFLKFPLPCEGATPRTSNGGLPFIPYQDQLPGTCRDFFAIDSWIHYDTPQGHWLWVTRDMPLAAFDSQQVLARRTDAPRDLHRVLAMLFDNRWYTNWVANSHGVMEFQFELVWKPRTEAAFSPEELADSLLAEPQVNITPSWKEDPLVARHLYRS
jgi:hypothetical protein